MPASKSASKGRRAAERKASYNKPIRTSIKSSIRRAEELIKAGDPVAAEEAVKKATKKLDNAANKSVIHRNNAARRKSRLVAKLTPALAAQKKPSSS